MIQTLSHELRAFLRSRVSDGLFDLEVLPAARAGADLPVTDVTHDPFTRLTRIDLKLRNFQANRARQIVDIERKVWVFESQFREALLDVP